MKYGILITIMVLAFVLAGCAQQNTTIQPAPDNTNTEDKSSQVNTDDVMVAKDIKSQTEVTQDQIDQLIADGTYEEDVSYVYHAGVETVTIKMSVENDVITELSITGNDPNPVSKKYIDAVSEQLQTLSVGKPISEVSSLPDQISGSSLTVAAFKQHTAKLIGEY